MAAYKQLDRVRSVSKSIFVHLKRAVMTQNQRKTFPNCVIVR